MEKKNSRFIRILIIVQVRCSIRFLKSDFVLVLKKYYSSCFSSFKIYYPTLWHFIINTKYNDVSRSRSQGQEDKNNDNALKLVRKESVRTRTKISEASRARNRHATGQFVVAYSSDCSSSLKNGLLRGWRRNEEKQLNNCHPVEAWSRWSYVLYKIRIGKRRIVTSLSPSLSDNLHSLSVDSPLWCRGMASYRQIEQETASSSPQVVERHSWYHVEGQSHKWRSTEKNRTNTYWEGDPRKKDAMAWSRHDNGWSTHSEASAALGSCGIQEKTWQTKDELERRGKEGPPKNWTNQGRGWSIRSRQTLEASTCGWPYASVMLDESSRVTRTRWPKIVNSDDTPLNHRCVKREIIFNKR